MNNSNVSVDTTITDTEEQKIVEALAFLHNVVKARGESVLPTFEKCGMPEYSKIFVRSYNALEEKGKSKREALLNVARQQIEDLITTYRAAELELVAEFNAMSPALRAKLGATMPVNVRIPYTKFVACFPAGTSDAYIVKALETMNLSVGKVKGSDELCVRIPINPEAKVSVAA